jgi:tRNA-splicing ligase RtcB
MSDDSMSEKYLKARQDFVYRRTRARVKTNTEGHFGFDLNSDAGKNYVKDMDMALDFALANRQDMINKIIKSMEDVLNRKIKTDRFINRNHNHAEIKDGFAIHRKGATHAEKDMMGVIPGNMKDGSFIVNGKGNEDSMCSSSHGAGRVLSRRKAKDTLDVNDFHDDMKGIVTNHTDTTVDESPRAYKNIFEVMELQNDLVEVVDYIKPILNIKG